MSRSITPATCARPAIASVAALVLLTACELNPVQPEGQPAPEAAVEARGAASGMTKSNAAFPTWQQNFQHDVEGWEYEGADWCGSIERVTQRGPSAAETIAPSAGRAFARVAHGGCDARWEAAFELGSGPASSAMPQGESFPTAGYVMELDIHLDPEWDEGTAFGYSASFRVLDQDWPWHFRYYLHDIVVSDGVLSIDGHPIDQAGWHTFRHRFASDDEGSLVVHFEVVKRGQRVFSEELPVVLEFPEEGGAIVHETGDFPVSNASSAYLWFSYLSPGLELAIDRQMMRPGR